MPTGRTRNSERKPPAGWIPPKRYRRSLKFRPDARFWRLRAEGYSMRALAKAYGVSLSTIHRMLSPHEHTFYELPALEQVRLRAATSGKPGNEPTSPTRAPETGTRREHGDRGGP